jgi:hypothetical protein
MHMGHAGGWGCATTIQGRVFGNTCPWGFWLLIGRGGEGLLSGAQCWPAWPRDRRAAGALAPHAHHVRVLCSTVPSDGAVRWGRRCAGTAAVVRRFMGPGLEECGPQGLDFLTVLGSHEGSGLVMDR